jgi:prevent-host-death family protein
MTNATAAEFQRRFGEFQLQAQREPVEITRHGRRKLVLMSADHYDWLLAAAKRTHRTDEAAPVVVEAVRNARMKRYGRAFLKRGERGKSVEVRR